MNKKTHKKKNEVKKTSANKMFFYITNVTDRKLQNWRNDALE